MSVMKSLLPEKIRVSQAFRFKLISFGDATLLHSVEDRKWGIGINTCDMCHPFDLKSVEGSNTLGVLLMSIRDDVLKADSAPISDSRTSNISSSDRSTTPITVITTPRVNTPAHRSQPSEIVPQVIIMGSSNIKHVDPRKCFGSRDVIISRQPTAKIARKSLTDSRQIRDLMLSFYTWV
jgi:hypothetical protein